MPINTNPTNPYAVLVGMPGYLPNTCEHYASLSEALEAAADTLERIASELDEETSELAARGESDDDEGSDASGCVGFAELLRSAARNGADVDGETYASGASWDIDGVESLWVDPISPEDFNAETEGF